MPMTPQELAIAATMGCCPTAGMLQAPRSPPALPHPGTPAFERMIAESSALAKRRQPAAEERVPDDVAEERRLADAFLTGHLNRLRRIEG